MQPYSVADELEDSPGIKMTAHAPSPIQPAATRSGFVTAIAWIFIAFAGLGTVVSLLQNMMLAIFLSNEDLPKLPPKGMAVPPMAEFMFQYGHLFFVGFLLLSALGLASGIGLLRRKNWARLVVIALLAFGVVWNLGGTAAGFFFIRDFMPPEAPPEFKDNFDLLFKVMMAFNFAIALAFAGLFAWIIRRLMSPGIRGEFNALPDVQQSR